MFSEIFNNISESVYSQSLGGTYVKRRPSKCKNALIALGIINIALSISSFYTYLNTSTSNIEYYDSSTTNNKAFRSIVFLPKGVNNIYIGLEGVYQNYLYYTQSINYNQLKGKTQDLNLSKSSPFDYYDNKPYYPAGAIAATYFQDDISITSTDSPNLLKIDINGISRSVDKNMIGYTQYFPDQIVLPLNWTANTNKNTNNIEYSQPLNTFDGSGLPILNERFVNWIALAPFNKFKKLWGKVNIEKSGNYIISGTSNYDLATKKSFFISEKSMLGIPNYYSSILFLIVGLVSIGLAIYLSKYGY